MSGVCFAKLVVSLVSACSVLNAPTQVTKPADAAQLSGLSKGEAERLLKSVSPNAMPDTATKPLRSAISKVWAPVPWMLGAAIALEMVAELLDIRKGLVE